MIDINDIKKNYATFDDAKITQLAKRESKGLRADVAPILLVKKGIAALSAKNQSNELIELFIMNNICAITLENDSEEIIQQLLTRYNEIEYGNEV